MTRQTLFVIALLAFTGHSVAAQAPAPPAKSSPAGALTLSLGPLVTGRIQHGGDVGSVGMFHSDLRRMVQGSPEAERYSRAFTRNARIGRPIMLVGAALVIGALTGYATRRNLGMGGPGIGALAAGGTGLLIGANRLDASRRAAASAVDAFNEHEAP